MHKEEIQEMLSKFGFSIALNKEIGTTGLIHIIHRGTTIGELVEYTLEEATDMIKNVWMFRGDGIDRAETTTELEIWLGK